MSDNDTVTLEEVWKLFREVGAGFKELRERSEETDRQMKETDRQIKESERRYELMRAETDRVVKDVSRQVGALTSKWGLFLEGVIAPACEWLFTERGIPVHEVFHRVKSRREGRTMEVDLLVVNDDAVVVVEVKSTLTAEDVQDHLDHLTRFKTFFPRYADCRIFGAVAGIVADGEVLAFARRKGLFVIVQSGENVRLDNDPDFVPTIW